MGFAVTLGHRSLIAFGNPRVAPRIGNDVSWVLLSHLVTVALLCLAIPGSRLPVKTQGKHKKH